MTLRQGQFVDIVVPEDATPPVLTVDRMAPGSAATDIESSITRIIKNDDDSALVLVGVDPNHADSLYAPALVTIGVKDGEVDHISMRSYDFRFVFPPEDPKMIHNLQDFLITV